MVEYVHWMEVDTFPSICKFHKVDDMIVVDGISVEDNLIGNFCKAGQFIIEYCGEVISSEEAKERSQTYETEGLMDAYIIFLNANYFIDATNKGSLARFINHSCQPNCETRKWTVLGETRVGIFAKQDISVGTELAYDYNFEWYGGANVRCLCGAPNCSIFLGAKSQGFQGPGKTFSMIALIQMQKSTVKM